MRKKKQPPKIVGGEKTLNQIFSEEWNCGHYPECFIAFVKLLNFLGNVCSSEQLFYRKGRWVYPYIMPVALPRSQASQVFGRTRDCERSRSIAQRAMTTLSVGAKFAGKTGRFCLCLSHLSLRATKIAPFAPDYESARRRLGTR